MPPFGILDGVASIEEHQGCPELRRAVDRVKPRVHIFGHVHSGYGKLQAGETLFVNAALLGPLAEVERTPILVTVEATH
jgi:Icc-related predicted phosphoesterase